MKHRWLTILFLFVLTVSLAGTAQATTGSSKNQASLIYVKISSPDDLSRFGRTSLPMYARLDSGLLTAADSKGQQTLQAAGLQIQVLDPELHPGAYYLAEQHSSIPAVDFASYGRVLLTTPHGALLRLDPSRVDALNRSGVELQAITLTPKPLPAAQREEGVPAAVSPDPIIQGMIDQVTQTQVYTYDKQLAGYTPVWVDGGWYTIPTRYTYSGTPIQKTTSFVGQHMADLGMNVDYHVWNNTTNPDVVGEIPGQINPENIFIIGAHIDDVSGAPGADDNGSGSVATLLAADILSQFQWGCTLRFAFWTGEEQGLLGSESYAQEAYLNGENIVGYLNLDMIAWNTLGSDPYINLIYSNSIPHSQELAQLFADAIQAYHLNLLPRFGTGISGSDHSSFWQYGFNSILAIEDDLGGDFNPYYHSPGDTPQHTDPIYFTNFVKASLATYAHLTGCLIPGGVGHLDGHVTAASGGAPIEGATLTASDNLGHNYPASSDVTGYYTRTLQTGTYTVTASAYSYLPSTVSGVDITTDTVTTQDFSLVTAPAYVVSGTVTESGTGLPLAADISFDGSPVTVSTDPATGFYQAELPQNSYTMHVRSALHRPQQRSITLDQDQTQNFALEPLPCVLLVDDDQNNPDVNSYYTDALNGLGVSYDIWDTNGSGDPSLGDIYGYRKLLWYTGYPYHDTFNSNNEATISSFLDAGGNFFLSSQDYLWERQLTPFGQNYLHILNYQNDVGQLVVTGQNVFSGLGPYTLAYPFTNYSDVVNPDGQSQLAFSGNQGNAAISYAGPNYHTSFFAYPFEAIPGVANRQAVLGRLLDFFGSCQPDGWLDGHVTDASTGYPLSGVSVSAAPGALGAGVNVITDPSGYYTMTLPAGTYTVTASVDGYTTQSIGASVTANQITTLDFALQPVCEAVSNLDFTWLPLEPQKGEQVSFTATAGGTGPIDYLWNFGDTSTGTGATVTHSYVQTGTYSVDLSASNACSSLEASKNITIYLKLFLPFLVK